MFGLNYKKLISVFLSLAMLISSVLITGIVAQAADLDSLFGTTNTYDHDGIVFKTNSYDGHPASSVVVNGEEVMASSTKPLYFSAYGVSVEAVPNELGADRGNALHFIDARSPSVYYYAKARIYEDDTEKLTQYKPNANTTYEIKFKYNVVGMTVSSFKFQVRQVAYQEIEYYGSNKDLGKEVEICTITEPTNGWVDAYATFTTSADAQQYMALGVVSGSEDAVNGIDVWVDDVVVSECVNVTAHNYDTVADKAIPVSKNTTIADIQIPDVAGYRFCGIYADAQYSTKLDTSVKAGLYTDLYFKWEPLVLGQYYCGFEDYKPQAVAMSYDADVVAIGGEATYVGSKALKATLNAKGLTAFELRNDKAFEIVKNTVYTLTFAYKASADVEIYAGVGKAGDVPNTAEALAGTKLTGDSTWKIATINVTPDKGTAEGYAITMLVFADAAAEVFVDDVLVAGPEQGYENPSINTNFDNSWYPGLALFEGIEMPEQIVYWDGSTEEPVYNEASGVYEISKPSQLAYVIYTGGGAGYTYKLLKDIYLNDTDKIDWANGTVAEGYTAQQWYKSSNWTWTSEGGKYTDGAATDFQGTIDGNNHTIYGLYFNSNTTSPNSNSGYGTGLIPRSASGATVTIKNLGLDNVYINSAYGAAGFVGVCQSYLNFENCYIGEQSYIEAYRAAAFRGYDSEYGTTAKNCYTLATIKYKTWGGMFTTFDYLTISNSFNAKGLIANYHSNNKISVTNCYQLEATTSYSYSNGVTTLASTDSMKGQDIFTDSAKMPNLNSSKAYVATEGYPKLAVHEGIEVVEIWDGTTEAPVYNEVDSVYEISKPSQLAYVIYTGGGAGNTYKLLKDIYLNDTDKIDWANGTVAEGYTAQQWYKSSNWTWSTEGGKYANGAATNFQGTIDGNNHTVYGLYFTNPGATYQSASWYGTGLIPRAANGGTTSIKNLGLDCVYIDSTYGAGGFVGVLGADGTATLNIDNCFIGENASITGYRAAAFRGYESGSSTTISNCYSLAKVNYQAYGGLLTTTDYATISNTYIANGTIANYGSSWKGSITNCYQTIASNGVTQTGITTVAELANMQGMDVFTNAAKMPKLNSSNAYVATEGYPVLKSFQDEASTDIETPEENAQIEVWKGTEDLSEPVDSDNDGVYEITNGAELAYAISTGGGYNYIFTKDIYLNEIDKINWSTGAAAADYSANGWYSAYSTPFTGNIDGNGHTVYGMRYTTDSAYAAGNDYAIGLIPRIAENTQVTIKNLAVDKSFMKYSHHAAAIVGIVGKYSTVNIEGCYFGADTTIVGYNASAFRGAAGDGSTTNISKCYTLADLNANGGNYGLVGSWGYTNISYSYNSNGPITSSTETYKISLSNCYQSVNGGNNTGVTTITDAKNMKGEDVLSNSSKMSGLASANAFVPTYLDFAGHDYYIYLPAGTVFTKDLQPSFFDTFFIGVDTEAVLLGNTMVTGAYVKFGVEPTAEDIKVPTSLANFVHQGTMAEIKAMDYQTKYFGIQSEIVKQELDKQSADAVNYIFITDIHYDGNKTADYSVALFNQMNLVVDMANTDDSIDFIAIGGDIIEGTTTGANAINLIQTILEPLKNSIKPVLVMIGNHDDNSYGSWSAYIGESNFNAGKSDDSYFAADKLISKYQWDEGIIKEFVHKDIVQPSIDGVPQRYYYYDLVKNGKTTRIYVLDCIDYEVGSYNDDGTINELLLDDGKTAADEEKVPALGTDLQYKYKMGASEMTYSDTQIEWLESSLKAGGYDDVIFLSHAGIDKETMGVSTNGDKLRALIADFNNKTGELADTNGKIMSYQFGHVHAERELYSADINLWQICSGNATPQAVQNTGIQTTPWRDHAYSMGTETEAQFDVMSVTKSGIVKFGIGGASDQKLTSYLTFATGDVNTDETVDICDLVKLNLVANGASNKIASVDVNKDKAFIFAVDAEALRKLIIGAK